jgi:hypothetical protein
MDLIFYLINLVLMGLAVGALGRLAVPGPTPMSIVMTVPSTRPSSPVGPAERVTSCRCRR